MNAMPKIWSLLILATTSIWAMDPPSLVNIHPASPSQAYTQEQNELIEKLISQKSVLQHDEETKDNIRKRIIRLLPIYLSRRAAHNVVDFVQQYGQEELVILIHGIYKQAFDDHIKEEVIAKCILEIPG